MERLNGSTERPNQAILEQLNQLSDPTRCRLLLLLQDCELTVSELCTVLQLPQSTVSRHLKTLLDGGWLTARREGTSRRYQLSLDLLESGQRELWALVSGEVTAAAVAEQDRRRLVEVLKQNRVRSQEFFAGESGRWAQRREELFGRRFHLVALPALLNPDWTLGDLGAGDGQTTASLAPFLRRVIAVDESAPMLEAAATRLQDFDNVELRRGELEALPIRNGELDAAVIFLVLHHLPEPATALAEAARALRPGGRLLVVDMLPHEHEAYRQEMGHLWLGFEPRRIRGWLQRAGFESIRLTPLPPDAEAQGPTLFAASANRCDEQ
jgi:SAM-dependent methyltransferase